MLQEEKVGYGWLWRAEIVKPSFQFYKMGTEATRHEKGKEMKGSSRGRPRVHQRPCMDLRKLGSCL